ncbi:hypothetical protein ABW19_dt0204246 [Dactylella cylindrospora]|nr:hypothetical protein ABW19_dt0204246 [Dactylella cylindrospora]
MDSQDIHVIRPLEEYTIAWICALPLEQAACCALLDFEHTDGYPDIPANAKTIFLFGSIRNHNIVISTLPKGCYGNMTAATAATEVRTIFPSISIMLMVGIGGGIPSLEEDVDIRLGDVVVSVPDGNIGGVFRWDMGKAEAGGFNRTGSMDRPPAFLLGAVANLDAYHYRQESRIPAYLEEVYQENPKFSPSHRYPGMENDNLYAADYKHPDWSARDCSACDRSRIIQRSPRDSHHPVIHYGVIASGDQVVKDAGKREELRRLKAKCVEMEGAGTMDANGCLIIRGICDYADSHKNKRWQKYAALTAAAYAKELLQGIPSKNANSPTAFRRNSGIRSPSADIGPSPTARYNRPYSESRVSSGFDSATDETAAGAAGEHVAGGPNIDSGAAYPSTTPLIRDPTPRRGLHSRKTVSRSLGSHRMLASETTHSLTKDRISRVLKPESDPPLKKNLVKPAIAPRYSMTAVGWGKWCYRVYFQNSRGLFEANRETDEWTICDFPHIKPIQYSPLAVVARKGGEDIRLFYVNSDLLLREMRYTGRSRVWRDGSLNKLQIKVSPQSSLAAVGWSGFIRVYYQTDDTDEIQELCYKDLRSEWKAGNSVGSALKGTKIAAAAYIGHSDTHIHLFFQGEDLRLRQFISNGKAFIEDPGFAFQLASGSSFAACGLHFNSGQVWAYWKGEEGKLVEYSGNQDGLLPKQELQKLEETDEEPDALAAVKLGECGSLKRNLFVYKGDGGLFEGCWAADGKGWAKMRRIDIN